MTGLPKTSPVFGRYPPPYRNFNGITSQFGAHFILRIDKILMKEKYYNAIVNGVRAKDFPAVPWITDTGFQILLVHRFTKPIAELLPVREGSLASVRYAADRIDPNVKFTDEACMKLVRFPASF